MPRFLKHKVVWEILEIGLLPVFYNGDVEVAKKIVQACADGGARAIEFTNRGDFAHQIFSELAVWCSQEFSDIILGAGTIIDPATAALYINCGANFIVGPVFNHDVAKICNRRKVAYIPGCQSPSEISKAEEMGADIVKVFPADVVTPKFINAVLGPSSWTKMMPSGGVKAESEDIFAWIKAGVAVLNMGSSLIRKDLVEAGDFDGIRKLVEQCILWIKEARGEPLFLGVEHVALYPNGKVSGDEISEWYVKTFGFVKAEQRSSFFVSGQASGRIEILKEPEKNVRCHIAIRVSNFEKACNYLKERGIKLEEPIIKKNVKAAFLKNPDPAGNRVHILYQG
jgi:2-dehydro-3-deoxyphosphogluconate aldolase/(4S)-4-hydroxy-2-oxoglutarate aldolase